LSWPLCLAFRSANLVWGLWGGSHLLGSIGLGAQDGSSCGPSCPRTKEAEPNAKLAKAAKTIIFAIITGSLKGKN
jgi:hypothetical protein